MDDDDCMGILWSLHQWRIEFNQLEESIQATKEAADELEEQLVATNFTVAALLAQRFTRYPRERAMYVRSGRWFEETLPRLGEQQLPCLLSCVLNYLPAVLGFPNAIGALDGCHLPVSPPKDSAVDYRNYKGWYSVILLALVDHRYLFRYISVGSPGKCHDVNVYG
ncbi:hypothetical protein HPB47_020700 [Ixodes persulcatus]|uniref:Uncharacterized protein n=1 Tax=Ixodes persulcatus TaxID=34615 RepID=A0AC60QGW9_IXOPE|nr:hypothetical protein HPB47_020700 [Ixodes persulcatus]